MRSLLLAILLVSAISAQAALDLSPFPSELNGEGIKYTQLRFKDGQRRVSYVPPQNWTWRGGSAQLHLMPPASILRAGAVIETAPLAAPQSLDEKTIAALRQQFLNTLPPGAAGAKIVSEEQGPLQLSGNIPTYEFTATYQALGEIYVHSTLFANLADAQLRFRFTSLKKDFDSLHRTFRASLISWEWQEPATSSAERLTASQ